MAANNSERAKPVRWPHSDLFLLMKAHAEGGVDAVYKAFPHRSRESIDDKLAVHGMLSLNEHELVLIADVAEAHAVTKHPGLFRKTLATAFKDAITRKKGLNPAPEHSEPRPRAAAKTG